MTNTPQWIEEYNKEFFPSLNYSLNQKRHIYDFIETQIAQAEKRGEENMRAKTIEFIDNVKYESHYQEEERGFYFGLEHIKNSLSSL